MFAQPGRLGMGVGRLGLGAGAQTLVAQALAILAKYGSAANLYLPGVGAISGITAGNWLDSAGTTAATVDNTVGLVVSAAKEVGYELVTNGTFDSSLSGWTGAGGVTNSWSSGTAITAYSFATGGLFQDIPFTGNTALITVRAKSNLGTGSFWVLPRTGGFAAPNTVVSVPSQEYADYRCVVTREAGASGIRVYLNVGPGAILQVDSVSVRELPGAHLTQSTAASRPILRLSSGVYSWQFDGINDQFTSTLTPGASGFMAAAVNRASTNVRHIFFGGGQEAASAGAGARFLASGVFQPSIANGTTRQQFATTATLAPGTDGVASFWWGGSRLGAAINNTETDTALTVNPTSATQIFLAGAVAVNYFDGAIGATIIMPTVLPTPGERNILRRFIASLSGVTM